jgi:plasmid maintenance system killer protein
MWLCSSRIWQAHPATVWKLLKETSAAAHSIRVNDQYRLTFRWEGNHAYEVRCEDYHA